MTGHLTIGEDQTIIFEGATDDAYETTLTVADPTADRTITLPNVTGTVVTTGDTATITATMLAADSVDSSELVDGSIDTSHISSGAVTTAKLAADVVTGAKIADDAIDSEHYTDGSIDTAHIGDSQVTTAKIADANVSTAKITDANITTAKLATDAVTTAKITDLNVTTAKIAADAITGAKIADDVVDSEHLAADSIDAEHYAPGSVDATALASNAVTVAKIADAELTTLAGMQSGTASKLADSTALTADLADLNQIDGMAKQTTITDDDTKFPTSGAVVDYFASAIQPFGGIEVIADEDNFPTTQPASGVVISIADAGGVVFNGSGVSTTARTAGNGSDNVTINSAPASLYSETLVAGVGMMVTSTGSSNTYNYHKILGKEDDIKALSDDINDFNARYRIASSAPGSNNDDGDLYFDTTANKMKVYNASSSSWDDVATPGNFLINTISSSSGSGGGSATFNGTATRFTLSNPPDQYAQQLLVSINGVIQKPNSGTSPSEGFAIDGNDIIFAAAPASGADYFIVTQGSSVNIGTPSNNTVTTAIIQSGAVTTAKLAADAVDGTRIADDAINSEHYTDGSIDTAHIADLNVTTGKIAADAITGAKIADDAINSEHYVDGSIDTAHIAADQITGALIADDAVGSEHIEQLDADLSFADNVNASFGAGGDLVIKHDGSDSYISNVGTGELIIQAKTGETGAVIRTDGSVELFHDNTKKCETGSAGIIVSGYVSATGDNGYAYICNDSLKSSWGTGLDLNIYHDGTNSIIKNDTNTLVVRADIFKVTNNADTETILTGTANGSVALYYDNSTRFETTSSGSTFTNGPVLINHSDGINVYGSVAMLETTNYGWIHSYSGKGVYVRPTTNGAYMDSGNTSWSSGSDERTKTGLTPITDALTKIKGCRSVIGRYKTDEESKKRSFLIAQDFQTHFPEAVSVDPEKESDENLGLRYQDVIPLLLAGIKELSAEVETLKTKVAALEAK